MYSFLFFAALAMSTVETEPTEAVQLDVDQMKKVDVVSQDITKDGKSMTIVLKPKSDQFTADFAFPAGTLEHIKIVIKGAKEWDTVRWFPVKRKGRTFLNLIKTGGISVDHAGNDCVIEVARRSSVHLLAPEGRLVFRMAYGSALDMQKKPELPKN